jgi:D-inositol-3-phosphate glycosyltransferase
VRPPPHSGSVADGEVRSGWRQRLSHMRVVLVSHHAFPHIGGVETLVDMEVRALAEAGHEVVLISSNGKGQGVSPCYPGSVKVIRVFALHFLERFWRLPYPIFSPRLLWHLWREIARCDCVHVHGFVFMSSVLALLIAWLQGRPRLLTDHGGVQHFDCRLLSFLAWFTANTLGRLSARLANRLVTYNTRILQFLDQLVGVEGVTRFVPNPINKSLFRPPTPVERRVAREELGWATDRPKVLFVGRLLPEKGVALLLATRDPSFDLVFCGPGDGALLGTPLPEGVQHLPPRPPDELVRLYYSADLLVVPSALREGFPLVIQEALACHLPVVTCHDPGYEPYGILPTLLLCQRDSAAIGQAIRRALAAPKGDSEANGLPGIDDVFPSPQAWLHRLFAGLTSERAEPTVGTVVEPGKGVIHAVADHAA